ncbi:probable U3 small nucleolar RNA-associated 11 [Olea europaea subsp. europaea]|uniref:Probable U3 small nucleolar RNA-associated 11 n=1 Tax=Olea europaea subsp. europaea TaxID=158383 RepID=A0A8S0VD50_OLEEU|nr:probable U3 small nucleolar RNA-associated 11 [Olea europaea subsp. europaea]
MSSIRKQIHKDYIERARAYHQKKRALRKLKLKAALRDPDEFYLKRIKTKKFGVFYKLKRRANKYLKDDLKYILLKKV